MKVKKSKCDELVDALKQLKLADRHSGFSLHTRLPRTANDHSLRNRLTRSLSAVAPCLHHPDLNNSIFSCTSTCPPNNMGACKKYLSKRLTESVMNHSTVLQSSSFSIADFALPVTFPASSDNSPVSIPVGQIHNTLPIDAAKQAGCPCAVSDPTRSSSTLRRNIVSELDQFFHHSQSERSAVPARPCGKCYTNVSLPSKITGYTSSSTSGISPRSKLCSHHGSVSPSGCFIVGMNRATLPQLNLFRRLYSLIDHPCINLYHTCRYSGCSHMSLTSEWATTYTPRRLRQQNSRHRHSLGSSGNITNYFATAATTSTNTEDNNSTESYGELPLSTGISSGFNWPCNTQPVNPESTGTQPNNLIHSACSSSLVRCRRNSDPERWQQQQMEQPNLKRAAMEENGCTCLGAYQGSQRTRRFSRSGPVSQKSTDIPSSSPLPSPSVFSNSTVFPVRRATQDVARSVSDSGKSSQFDASAFLGFTQKNDSPSFSFRTPVPSGRFNPGAVALGLQGDGDCLIPDADGPQSPVRSTSDTLTCWSLSESQQVNPGGKAVNLKVDVNRSSSSSDTRRRSDGVTAGITDSGEILPLRQYANKLGSASKELCQQSPCEDTEAGEQSVTMMSMMMTSDVSVSELAGYMEHMVHIPGRMSEMAQRMYI